MLAYPSDVVLPRSALRFLYDLLVVRQRQRGTLWRRLPASRQALRVLAHLWCGHTYAALARHRGEQYRLSDRFQMPSGLSLAYQVSPRTPDNGTGATGASGPRSEPGMPHLRRRSLPNGPAPPAELSIVCALLSYPYRARGDSRFTGTLDRFTRPSANAEISSTRSIARAIAVLIDFVGGIRSRRSSSETRLFYGTTSKLSQRRRERIIGPARDGPPPRTDTTRPPCGASDTCRASTETPGSSTLRLSLDPFTTRIPPSLHPGGHSADGGSRQHGDRRPDPCS